MKSFGCCPSRSEMSIARVGRCGLIGAMGPICVGHRPDRWLGHSKHHMPFRAYSLKHLSHVQVDALPFHPSCPTGMIGARPILHPVRACALHHLWYTVPGVPALPTHEHCIAAPQPQCRDPRFAVHVPAVKTNDKDAITSQRDRYERLIAFF